MDLHMGTSVCLAAATATVAEASSVSFKCTKIECPNHNNNNDPTIQRSFEPKAGEKKMRMDDGVCVAEMLL